MILNVSLCVVSKYKKQHKQISNILNFISIFVANRTKTKTKIKNDSNKRVPLLWNAKRETKQNKREMKKKKKKNRNVFEKDKNYLIECFGLCFFVFCFLFSARQLILCLENLGNEEPKLWDRLKQLLWWLQVILLAKIFHG